MARSLGDRLFDAVVPPRNIGSPSREGYGRVVRFGETDFYNPKRRMLEFSDSKKGELVVTSVPETSLHDYPENRIRVEVGGIVEVLKHVGVIAAIPKKSRWDE